MVSGKPKDASAATKFRLLMWKNFLQQWRHWMQSLAELVLPIGTLSLVLILRWQIEPQLMDAVNFNPFPAYTIRHSYNILLAMDWQNISQISIAYSPESPELDDVVRSATVNFLLQNAVEFWPNDIDQILELLPPELIPPDIDINLNVTAIYEFMKSLVNVRAFNSSQDLVRIYADENQTRLVLAAVEFDDSLLGATSLPMNMSYALRFPERPRLHSFFMTGGRTWRTDASFPRIAMPGPRYPYSSIGGHDPGYVNELFIAMQHVVSMELISRMTGRPLRSYEVNIQRFPHPAYVSDYAIETLQILLPMFILLSFSYTAVNITRAVTVEKEQQLKETMKIMGLPTWLHWTAWFCKQFIYMCIISVVIVILLKGQWFTNQDGYSEYAIFTNTPWSVLFFYFNLYFCCMIFFCFMLSGLFCKGSRASLFTGLIWFLTYIPAFILLMDVNISASLQAFTCLSINSAMAYGFQLLLSKENTGGLQWGEFMLSPDGSTGRFVFGQVVIMLAVDCALYMLAALYLEQVMPGALGSPRPWYFPVQRQFWFPTKVSGDTVAEYNEDQGTIRENDPTHLAVGVKITNLTKVYGSNKAVNNLNLSIYEDQITVLLGHNGAGKSTTISMITGNIPMTSGSVSVGGYDMSKERRAARASLSLCPQHNVLFNELTVREHLEFFARLKGYSGRELYEEIDTLIEKLELQEKRDTVAASLSGGQKRRLCVGIALSGGARVVLLDEPTSGMDPASRRALWDLLQKEKKGRAMILTTHFMDEADVLGDRVAIMSGGRLQCVGTPYFLKQLYGVGYTLVVVKEEGFDGDACTRLIANYIPHVTIKEDRGTEITYCLTNDYSHTFEALLKDLQHNAENIKFKNYGLVATTLEDVFMRVGSDVEVHEESTDLDSSMETATDCFVEDGIRNEFDVSSLEKLEGNEAMLVGVRLWWQQACAVWRKLWLSLSRSWMLLVLQVLVPILNINASLGVLRYILSFAETVVRRPLTITQGYTETETLLSYNGTSTNSTGYLATEAFKYMFNSSGLDSMGLTYVGKEPLDEYYLGRVIRDPKLLKSCGMKGNDPRNRLLIGATFEEEAAVAWFSNQGYHDIANALATVHSALLKAMLPDANLTVYNHPLEVNYRDNNDLQTMVMMLSMQLSSGIGNSLVIVSAVYVMFYVKERKTGAKLLQQSAGLPPLVMWGAAAIFDWIWFLVLCLSLIAACLYFNVPGFSGVGELGRLYVCFAVYGAALMPLNYLVSHVLPGPSLGFVIMFFVNTLIGMIGAQIVEALSSPALDTQAVANGLDAVLQFFPLYSVITGVRHLTQVGLTRYSCEQACDYLSAITSLPDCSMSTLCEHIDTCCIEENVYFNWETPGIMRYLVCMLASGAVFWLALLAAEYRLLRKLIQLVRKERVPPPVDESTLDPDVVEEAKRVEQLEDGALLVRALSKYYGNHLAVDRLSFGVNDGECFGLLGVNGAGKTTTFKMLMGDEIVSSGDAVVDGCSIKRNVTKAYRRMGYCPQFDALFVDLTGRENLQILCAMRGLPPRLTAARLEALAHSIALTPHLDKRVSAYSGGNRRKASMCAALAGGARLILADEPTSGVDPAARRAVWRALTAARRTGRALLLTSHSMDECEALCSRLTIMVNGRTHCLGSPQHLKNKFSQGFTLTIKIKKVDDPISCEMNLTQAIKSYVSENFVDPKLMEEYHGLLTYYLPDRTVAWSTMFGIMERAKTQLHIEDYSISQTTLEQIFLHFTKFQRATSTTAS